MEELNVIKKSKELCNYVITVTHKSPKIFRFTLVSKMQSYCLSAVENLFRANEMRMDSEERINKRRNYQLEAMTDFRLLGFISEISRDQQCILPKQHEFIIKQLFECRNLLAAWAKSDAKRIESAKKKSDNN